MDNVELGKRIRIAREEAELSQEVVAAHLKLPRSAVSLIENGKRKIDSLELREFARLVNKSTLFFFENKDMATNVDQFFVSTHLPPHLQEIAKPIEELAKLMDESLPDNDEKSAGMRKLLEAKDCFVRAKL